MKLILSPAKKMKIEEPYWQMSEPHFLKEAQQIHQYLLQQDFTTLQNLWKANDKIAQTAYNYLKQMDFTNHLTPAIMSYDGIQYQYLKPDLLEEQHLHYLQEHVYILSGFYGILRAFDAINLYRLEMQTKININGQNLYYFYGQKVANFLRQSGEPIINLASNEYSKLIMPHLLDYPVIHVHFVEQVNGKYISKATKAKIARGLMTRYIVEQQLKQPEQLKSFNELGYKFNQQLSTHHELFFELVRK